MDSPKRSVKPVNQIGPAANWKLFNRMYFPRKLRDAIDTTHDARCLNLTNISGDCSHTTLFGRRVHLDFQVEQNVQLQGTFNVYAELNLEAARTLAAILADLIEQAEILPLAPHVITN